MSKNRKKLIAVIGMTLLMLVVAAGCGTGFGTAQQETTAPATTATTAAPAATATAEPSAAAGNTAQTGNIISEDKARQAALGRVQGATAADMVEFKLDWDDGRQVYEGEIRYNGQEYEFEIDAVTGDFVSWSQDMID